MASVYESVTEIAAEIVGESEVLDALANKIRLEVINQAVIHRHTGQYIANVKTVKSVTGKDRIVYSDDPGGVPIEWGYIPKKRFKNSRRVQTRGTVVRRIPGQYIFHKAVARVQDNV